MKKETVNFVLYLPVDLAEKLQRRVQQERQEEPGRSISRLDVVRSILYEALAKTSASSDMKAD